MTLRNGYVAMGDPDAAAGAGLLVQATNGSYFGEVVLQNLIVRDNRTNAAGGGIALNVPDALANYSFALEAYNLSVLNNFAARGAGIWTNQAQTTMTTLFHPVNVYHSTFTQNNCSAQEARGCSIDAVRNSSVFLVHSLFWANSLDDIAVPLG